MYATVFGPADELTAVFRVVALVLYLLAASPPAPSAAGPAGPSASSRSAWRFSCSGMWSTLDAAF